MSQRKRERAALPMTFAPGADFLLCAYSPNREFTTNSLEREKGTKTPDTCNTKSPKFHVLHEHSSRTTEAKGIASVLHEACNFKHSVNNVSITFGIAA